MCSQVRWPSSHSKTSALPSSSPQTTTTHSISAKLHTAVISWPTSKFKPLVVLVWQSSIAITLLSFRVGVVVGRRQYWKAIIIIFEKVEKRKQYFTSAVKLSFYCKALLLGKNCELICWPGEKCTLAPSLPFPAWQFRRINLAPIRKKTKKNIFIWL